MIEADDQRADELMALLPRFLYVLGVMYGPDKSSTALIHMTKQMENHLNENVPGWDEDA